MNTEREIERKDEKLSLIDENEWTCTQSMLIYTSKPKHPKQSLTNWPKYKGISYSTCRD